MLVRSLNKAVEAFSAALCSVGLHILTLRRFPIPYPPKDQC